MLAGPGLAHAQLGVLATPPMYDEYDFTRLVIDVDDNIGNERSQQLLS
jgi:hypothetical protein